LFLGYKWFIKHNPSIDWVKGKVQMNRCPEMCRKTYFGEEPEDVVEAKELKEGEKILIIDINS
jgi:hypothetical protein